MQGMKAKEMAREWDMASFMELALDQARDALASGEFPVGCVIVWEGRVVASGARRGTGRGRPSEIDHAEIRALKHLESLDEGSLEKPFHASDAVLFCTMEPCLMCYAAIILSGIRQVVYAYEDVMGGGTGCDLSTLSPLYRECGVRVVPSVLRNESLRLFQEFFRNPSNRYWKGSLLERYTLDEPIVQGS
jgi:tRNA(adenine34) deaminase